MATSPSLCTSPSKTLSGRRTGVTHRVVFAPMRGLAVKRAWRSGPVPRFDRRAWCLLLWLSAGSRSRFVFPPPFGPTTTRVCGRSVSRNASNDGNSRVLIPASHLKRIRARGRRRLPHPFGLRRLVLVLVEHVTTQPRNPAAELQPRPHRPRATQFPRPRRPRPGPPKQRTSTLSSPGDGHERTIPGPVHHG
jgi:hypothetical protein